METAPAPKAAIMSSLSETRPPAITGLLEIRQIFDIIFGGSTRASTPPRPGEQPVPDAQSDHKP